MSVDVKDSGAPDAPPPGVREFNHAALHMGEVGAMVRIAESKHVLAVFDSCFSGTSSSASGSRRR